MFGKRSDSTTASGTSDDVRSDEPDRVLVTDGAFPDEGAGDQPAGDSTIVQPVAGEHRADAPVPTDDAPTPGASAGDASAEEPVDDERFDRRSSWYVLRKTIREFSDDGGTDLAASLTYYAVLSIFPAALALLSILGLVSDGPRAVNAILDVLRPLVSAGTLTNISSALTRLSDSSAAGATFLIGLLGAIWSASGYVGAFGRAMNRIYEVEEGRPVWRLRPMNLFVTVITLVLSAVALVILAASGSVATSIGDKLSLKSETVTVWNYAKWPVLVIIVIVIIDLLYYFTPNVRFPKFKALSVGAFVALLVWVVASAAFALYVVNFSHYDKTYGSVAGVIVALLWLWLTNLALLFGAELDAERERARELHRGLPAEARLQLAVRSHRGIDKANRRREKDYDRGRSIREQRVGAGDPGDRPF